MPIWCTTCPPRSRIGRTRSVTSTFASIAVRALTSVAYSPLLSPRSRGQLRADLDEELRLELGEVGQRAAHAAGGVVLGQPVGGHLEREDLAAARVVPVPRAVDALDRRVGLLLEYSAFSTTDSTGS